MVSLKYEIEQIKKNNSLNYRELALIHDIEEIIKDHINIYEDLIKEQIVGTENFNLLHLKHDYEWFLTQHKRVMGKWK